MSVPENQRHKGRLEVHIKAQYMASYTSQILSNPKTFDPTVDMDLIADIKRCARLIYAKSWAANKINAGTNNVQHTLRYRLQQESIALCDEMLAYIGIAKQVYHIRHKRMKHWAGLISETRTLLQAWKESDVRRYGHPIADNIGT